MLRCCSILVLLGAIAGPFLGSLAMDGWVKDLIPGWRVNSMPDMTGKVAIVTGPTINGIGYESCVELARRGAHVIMAGRNQKKGDEALKALKERVPSANVDFMVLDLADLASVKTFAGNFKARNLPLHILMNNAGIMGTPFTLTAQGLETQFGTNHLGHFLLTKLLLPTLEASAPSRIVTVSSLAAFFGDMAKYIEFTGLVNASSVYDFDHVDKDSEGDYNPHFAYGRSKLANVLFTQALDRRLAGKKVYANSCHPGGIYTNLPAHVLESNRQSYGERAKAILEAMLNGLLMSPAQGAVTQLYLASAPEIESQEIRGQFYTAQATHGSPPGSATEELQEHLWEVSEKLVAPYL